MKNNQEVKIILVNKRIAKEKYKFIYYEAEECRKCLYKNICTGKLSQGRVYEIISLIKNEKEIICPITKDKMIPVKVKLANIETSIPTKKALDNIITNWNHPLCENTSCPFRSLCFPKGLRKGDKIKIIKVKEKIICPLNYELTHVTVQPFL